MKEEDKLAIESPDGPADDEKTTFESLVSFFEKFRTEVRFLRNGFVFLGRKRSFMQSVRTIRMEKADEDSERSFASCS